MAEKRLIDKTGETVGIGVEMVSDVADAIKTAVGSAVTAVTAVAKEGPPRKTVKKAPTKKVVAKKAIKNTSVKKAVKKAPGKKSAKKAPAKKTPSKRLQRKQ